MRQRGRQSAASLTLVSSGSLERMERPEPPAGTPDAQADVWRTVTASLAADWFRPEQLPLLSQYCRHVVAANVIAAAIEAWHDRQARPEAQLLVPKERWYAMQEYMALLDAQRKESAAIAQLATKMRLSHQSTYDKSKSKPAGGGRPWQ